MRVSQAQSSGWGLGTSAPREPSSQGDPAEEEGRALGTAGGLSSAPPSRRLGRQQRFVS